jgi:hypothetical protein
MKDGVQLGDIMILKRGMSQILAVGQVVERGGKFKGDEDKQWLRDFDGWDLAGWCYVDWHKPEEPIQTSGLTRATIQRVYQRGLIEQADGVLKAAPARTDYTPDPPDTNEVSDDTLIACLIELGLRPGAAEELTQALRRIRLLAAFYLGRDDWGLTNEHDARTFLVVPLLIALGWAEQKMKIVAAMAFRVGRCKRAFPHATQPVQHCDGNAPLVALERRLRDKHCAWRKRSFIIRQIEFSEYLAFSPTDAQTWDRLVATGPDR